MKRYIGFLEEESNEESSASDDNDDDGNLDEEDRINKFLAKVQEF